MSTKRFHSNETLEMCDVKVNQDGRIEIQTKSFHTAELERLGKPVKAIRGRVTMSDDSKEIVFAPYAEGSRKPLYSKQVIVGSTTLAVTEDRMKVSFMVPRHLSKALMMLYIQSEIDEVKRRLDEDVYDSLVKGTPSNLPLYGEALQTSLPTNKENTPEALPIEGADAKASVALTESLDSQRRLACEPTEGLRGSISQKGGEA